MESGRFPMCCFVVGSRKHCLRPKLFKRSLRKSMCLLTDVPGTQLSERMNGWVSVISHVQWREEWAPSTDRSLPLWCLAVSSPELSTPHNPQGPEADASWEGGRTMPFQLQEFFWAFVPSPVVVQFTRLGSNHVTGCVLCSSLQPPGNTKEESIDWSESDFPAPAHLQSPEGGGG